MLRNLVLPFTMSLLSWQVTASCGTDFIPIPQIQGDSEQSPLLGKTLTTQGVVLGTIYPGSKQPALLIQNLQPDANPATSEALLIADGPLANLYQPGQLLQITGTVRELNQMTALTNISASEICAEQQPVPKLQLQLPVAQLADWEHLEGQYLQFPQTLIVNDTYPLARYGEILLADRRLMVATEVTKPGTEAQAFENQQQHHEIWLDDHSNRQNPEPIPYPTGGLSAEKSVRVGDEVRGVEGFLVQTKAGYRLLPTTVPQFTAANPRQNSPKAKPAGALRVASFNVLNFFTGAGQTPQFPTKRGASSAEELVRQQAKMIAALSVMDADIIGLLEVENNGYGADSALATIVTLLNNQLGSGTFAFIQTNEKPGTDQIKVALIYRAAAVKPIGEPVLNSTGPFARGSRAPLTQSFSHQASASTLTVSVNHFKSKGSCPKQQGENSDNNDGQSCWNASRVTAAKTLASWLATNPTGQQTSKQLVIGDLNAYRMEDPVTTLEQSGWQHLPGNVEKDAAAHWSFVFKGRSGSLDHALATPALAEKLVQFEHWHINADEPAVLDYNMEHKSKKQLKNLYAPTPFRSSDHDPLVMDFKF
ncbi:MAG: ExeM/NucH family extracellular endonuclease [Gammaproteobacteria bacterium]|nr:ExeM/NucH family extracellular endonuclease [Gammaproteobacteria bacterium]